MTTTIDRKPIFDAVRVMLNRGFTSAEVGNLDAAIDRATGVQTSAPPRTIEPKWVTAGRSKIGEREIPGPKHNSWIIGFWQKLGATWIKTDDADGPWCGGFMAWCLNEAGLPYPKNYPAAASFATWGMACKAQPGAIGVKQRPGGNHVFLIVGETADKRYYKALGGNQGNAVSIIDILKADTNAIRWPQGAGAPLDISLPVMARGPIGASEA